MKKMYHLITVWLCLFLCGCAKEIPDDLEIVLEESRIAETPAPSEKSIVVYVCGAVANPGVYTLEETARIADLVEAAGNVLPEADLTRINLAEKLMDGQQVIVPEKTGGESPQGSVSSGKVNLNFADREELMTLPGVGAAKAGAIIAYREENGWFSSKEEIMNISGIKEGLYAGIADLIEV